MPLTKLVLVAVAAGMVGLLALMSTRATAGAEVLRGQSSWARAATTSCWHMQNRTSLHDWRFWEPLGVYPPRDLSRIAYLRRVLLKIHRDGLAEIEAQATASPETQAVAAYRHMLYTIAAVARAADSGDRKRYDEANVRMVRAIVATRAAFERAGASYICSIAI